MEIHIPISNWIFKICFHDKFWKATRVLIVSIWFLARFWYCLTIIYSVLTFTNSKKLNFKGCNLFKHEIYLKFAIWCRKGTITMFYSYKLSFGNLVWIVNELSPVIKLQSDSIESKSQNRSNLWLNLIEFFKLIYTMV